MCWWRRRWRWPAGGLNLALNLRLSVSIPRRDHEIKRISPALGSSASGSRWSALYAIASFRPGFWQSLRRYNRAASKILVKSAHFADAMSQFQAQQKRFASGDSGIALTSRFTSSHYMRQRFYAAGTCSLAPRCDRPVEGGMKSVPLAPTRCLVVFPSASGFFVMIQREMICRPIPVN